MEFQAYKKPLVALSEFKYIGSVLTALYGDWQVVADNLRKARKQWARMSKFLGLEGSDPRTFSNFYNAVVQVTLLVGVEAWVMSPQIGRSLDSFHHMVTRHLPKMHPRRDVTGRCI